MRPPGKVRSPWFVIGATVATLGLYFVYWQYASCKEMKDHSGVGIGAWLGLAFAVMSLGVLNMYLIPAEVGQLYESFNVEPPVNGLTCLWNLIPGLGTLIWMWQVQCALNRYWSDVGIDA